MKKIVLYAADDGVEFLNENECMLYEKYAINELKPLVKLYLEEPPNYLEKYSVVKHDVKRIIGLIESMCYLAEDYAKELNILNNTYDIKQCIDKIRNIRQCIDNIRNKNEKLTINWITLKHHLYDFHYKFFSSTDVLNTEMSYVKVIIGRIFRCSILTGNEYTCDYYANNEHEYDKDYAKHVANKKS